VKLNENILMAAKNLQNNKVRSCLTMLGIIIGVTAVIVMTSIGEGAKQQITQNITAMGSNLLIVFPGRGAQRGGSFGGGAPLKNEVIPILQASSTLVAVIAPESRTRVTLKAGSNSYQTSVLGVTPEYLGVRNYQVASGNVFTEDDLKGRRRVVILGAYVAEMLFPGTNPVGQEIKIGRLRSTVVGVLQTKGQSGYGNNDDVVMMPLTTVQQRLSGKDKLSTIYIQVKSAAEMDAANEEIYNALLKYFEDDETKFNMRNQAEILSSVQQTTATFTLLLGGIAAVSLLVGGIGIMNIMLVAVTERIKEIGIRKALGAQKEEILGLFLIEAVMLSLTGGLVGIGLGWLGSTLISSFSGLSTVISLNAVVVSFVFAVLTGLFFGVYPAYKAAGLRPIDALRHE